MSDSGAIYYDPYDFEIDDNPYPIWKRMRDEMPIYRNDRYDFFALSRFDDVQACSMDWRTFSSGKGAPATPAPCSPTGRSSPTT